MREYIFDEKNVLPFEKLRLSEKDAMKIFNGLAVETGERDGLYKLYKNEEFYGLAMVENGKAKAKTKLC